MSHASGTGWALLDTGTAHDTGFRLGFNRLSNGDNKGGTNFGTGATEGTGFRFRHRRNPAQGDSITIWDITRDIWSEKLSGRYFSAT